MKDNFVLFPHFTHLDAIKQYSGPTTDTHTHKHKHTSNIHDSKRWESKWL